MAAYTNIIIPYRYSHNESQSIIISLVNKLKVILLSYFLQLADDGYLLAAVRATVVIVQVPGVNAKTVAPYDYGPAFWTICIFQRMAWNIS